MNGFTQCFSAVYEWSLDLLWLAIIAGISAALLAVPVLLINLSLRRWLSARQMGLLWGLVLLRLLVPFAPGSAWSLQNLIPLFSDGATIEAGEPFDYANSSAGSEVPDAAKPAAVRAEPVALEPEVIVPKELTIGEMIQGVIDFVLPLTWACGAVLYLAWTIIVYAKYCARLRNLPACSDERLVNLWEACRKQVGCRRRIPVLVCAGVQQPAVCGWLWPKLLLPLDAQAMSDEQLRMIMLHELAHVRSHDVATNWLLVVARACHWWNPVFWMASSRFQSLREQACDAFAVRHSGSAATRSYSELLLQLAARPSVAARWRIALPASILGFLPSYFRRRVLRNRLKALRYAGTTRSRWQVVPAAAMILAAAVCGLTDAAGPVVEEQNELLRWLPGVVLDADNWEFLPAAPLNGEPEVTRSYNIAKARERLSRDRQLIASGWTLETQCAWLVKSCIGHAGEPDDQWDKEHLVFDGDTFTLSASPQLHAEVAKNIAAWEQGGLAQICVATRFASAPCDLASAAGAQWRYLETFSPRVAHNALRFNALELPGIENPRLLDLAPAIEGEASAAGGSKSLVRAAASIDDYLPVAIATLNERQAQALIDAAKQVESGGMLEAPQVTAFNGQFVQVSDYTQTPFVVGFELDSAGISQPKIAVIDQGVKLYWRTTKRDGADSVLLDGRVELSQIDCVRRAPAQSNGEVTEITIPSVRHCHVDFCTDVPDGHSLLVACVPAYEKGPKFFYVLLTVRSLDEAAASE